MASSTGLAMLLVSPLMLAVVVRGWTYAQQDQWGAVSAVCASGQRQSPIDVVPTATDTSFGAQLSCNYKLLGDQIAGNIKNNGHTLQFDLNNTSAGHCTGVPGLAGTFNLVQFHMHWGAVDTSGSEHLIKGKAFPLEVHLLHMNSKYTNVTEAMTQPDAFAVVAVMFDVTTDATKINTQVDSIAQRIKAGGDLEFKGATAAGSVDVNMLSTGNSASNAITSKKFYTYPGSLTTPGCFESVQWIVADGTGYVSAATMAALRQAKEEESPSTVAIAPNFRAIQSLNGRVVTASWADATVKSAAFVSTLSTSPAIICGLIAVLNLM